MSEKVVNAALLGLGTVGTGVYKVIKSQEQEMTAKLGCQVKITKILVRNLEKASGKVDDPSVLTTDWADIEGDPSIDIVIELIGGVEPARTYILAALKVGKNVVTANKDLIAVHGKEILETARAAQKDFLFEAAVAGGIPIISPLKNSLEANHVTEVMGIVNGTTNFILTKMSQEGMEFSDALALATELGYAEADPTADVEGYDACRKIAILTSLVCGQQVDFEDIHTEGITKITPTDIKYAQAMGRAIKLLATSKKGPKGYTAIVAPFLLPASHPLYAVNGVFNAIFVHGNVLGDAMFYGSGAGKLPTASAVVADVVEMAKNLDKNIPIEWSSQKLELVDYKEWENRFFIRTTADKAAVERVFGTVTYVQAEGVTGELGFVTEKISEGDCEKKEAELGNILQKIRVA